MPIAYFIVYLRLRSVYTARMSEGGSFEWEEVPDLTSFSEEELKAQLEAFSAEERDVSYRRRVLQGRIDLLRAELVRRGGFSVSPEDLARALLGNAYEAKTPRPSDPYRGSEVNKGNEENEVNEENTGEY